MLFLDTSALIKRYIAEPGSELVIELMGGDTSWAASALAQLETQVTLCHLGLDNTTESELQARARIDWERFVVVSLATPMIERAVDIACGHRLRTLDSIHLAAAAQLPRPLTFLTFDRQQAVAARTLGFEVEGEA
jgi:predicted nucleic acid-binding protein